MGSKAGFFIQGVGTLRVLIYEQKKFLIKYQP
jgi:hypothetical protein